MRDETPDQAEDDVQRPNALKRAALRAIDASLRALQGWRNQIDAPEESEASSGDGKKRKSSAVEETAEAVAEVPRQKPFLRRALTVMLCLLLGGTVGALLSYRAFARMLDSREALVEHLQEEITELKKDVNHSEHALDKAKIELGEYRKALRETQKELQDARTRSEPAKPAKGIERPAAQIGASPSGTPRSRAPLKTGTCVTGSGDTSGTLAECLDKFNRP